MLSVPFGVTALCVLYSCLAGGGGPEAVQDHRGGRPRPVLFAQPGLGCPLQVRVRVRTVQGLGSTGSLLQQTANGRKKKRPNERTGGTRVITTPGYTGYYHLD